MFDDFFARRSLTKLIELARQRLYSQGTEMDAVVKELAQSKEDISLIRAYIAIATAAQLAGPPGKREVDTAFNLLRATERQLDQPRFGEILDIHRDLAEVLWSRRHATMGKTQEDESYTEDERELDAGIATLKHRLDVLVEGI
jgi:hypothetical protein